VSKIVTNNTKYGKAIVSADGGGCGDDLNNGDKKDGCYIPYNTDDIPPDNYECDRKELKGLRVFVCESSPFTGKVNSGSGGGSGGSGGQMPSMENLGKFLEENYFVTIEQLEESPIKLPGREDLREVVGHSGISEVIAWRDTIDMQKADTMYKYIRAVFMFIGILIVVYSVILFLAFQFDRVNNFLDVELLNMFTLGRLKTSADAEHGTYNDSSVTGGKLVTFKNMCVISLCGISIGILLISGKVFFVVMSIIKGIMKIFG
jgi:hypothetical protein